MPKIFIQYRRDDSKPQAKGIYDELVKRYGAASLYMDLENIDPGVIYPIDIDTALKRSSVVLVLIRSSWLTLTGQTGNRRLDEADDLVRWEIERAFRYRKLVVPVLLDGTSLPDQGDLPGSIEELARSWFLEVRTSSSNNRERAVIEPTDLEQIISVIDEGRRGLHKYGKASTPLETSTWMKRRIAPHQSTKVTNGPKHHTVVYVEPPPRTNASPAMAYIVALCLAGALAVLGVGLLASSPQTQATQAIGTLFLTILLSPVLVIPVSLIRAILAVVVKMLR